LHTLLQLLLHILLRHALISQLVCRIFLGDIALLLFVLFVEAEDAALFVETVLEFEENSGDVEQDEHVIVKACFFTALLVDLAAVVLDVRHQLSFVADAHRPQLILHNVDQELGLQLRINCHKGLAIVAFEIAENYLQTLIVDGLHMLQSLKSAIFHGLLWREGVFELAEIFKEGGTDERLLIFVDGYLRDLEDEVEQEKRHFLDIAAEYLEKVSELLGGDIDEVVLLGFAGLNADEVFALFVVVFAEKLQELEGPAVSGDAEFVVKILICGVGLKDVLSECVSLFNIVVVVVVDSIGREFPASFFLVAVCLNDVLLDEHAQLLNQGFDVLKHLVFAVFLQLLYDVLLSQRVPSQKIADRA